MRRPGRGTGHQAAGRGAIAVAIAVAVALAASLPAAADGHGPAAAEGPGSAVLSKGEQRAERALRRLEILQLGGAHAAEHAAVRAAERRARRTPRRAPTRRSRRLLADGPPSAVGAWDGAPRLIVRNGRTDMSLSAIHAVLVPTGKVLLFGPPLGPGTPRTPRVNESVAVLFDPAARTFEDVPPPIDPRTGKRANIYCSGASLMSDGRVLITGGYLDFDEQRPGYVNNRGLNHVWTFDPWTKAWRRHENLGGGTDPMSIAGGRWYPSQMLMPDGRTVTMLGIAETGTRNNWTVEVFDPRKPLGTEMDTLGSIPRFGTATDVSQYPHTFWMPSGRGYVVGPSRLNSWFMRQPAPLDLARTTAAAPLRERTWGTGVLLPVGFDATSGRVLLVGGSSHPNNDDTAANDIPASTPNFPHRRLPASPTAEVYDETANRWTGGSPLNVPRSHHNTVLLSDGGMATIGGGVGGNSLWAVDSGRAERQVELYDGTRWITGPRQVESRAYHSTALLLPDGSVLSAGDDNPGATDTSPQTDTYEIYRPRYFFNGTRPAITAAPAAAGYGETIAIGTPSTDIARAVLIAPGATTHATDMSQRLVTLPASRRADGTGYDIRTPLNANVALPGHYMLALVDAQNRPSPSTWIALATPPRGGPGPTPDTTPPTVAARAPAAGATGVGAGENVSVTFSEAVQGVGTSTFTLRSASGAVPAAVSAAGGTAWVLDPSAQLAPSTIYTATLTGGAAGIRDAAGNPLASLDWTFTTAAGSPPPATAFADDAFTRTVANGWGTAPVGGAWTTVPASGTAPFSVDGSAGRIATPAGGAERLILLGTGTVRDVDATASITFNGSPSSGNHLGYVILRHGADGYIRVGLVASGGRIALRGQTSTGASLWTDVATGLTIGTGTAPATFRLRVQLQGASPTTVRARAWSGTAEPSAWAIDTTTSVGPQAAGRVGFRAANTNTTTATTVGLDDFRLSAP